MLNKLSLRLKDHTCHPHKHHFQSRRAYVSSAYPRERRHRHRRRSRTSVSPCVSVCVSSACLRVKADAMPLTCLRCRGRSLLFSLCVCVTKFAFKKYLWAGALFKKKKKESVVFNEHVLEIVSASIIYKVRLHLWTGLVCKCEYLIIMKKIHLTQLLYWHNMTLLEQTDILGRRPVCVFVCVHILCVCVCVLWRGVLPYSERTCVDVGSIWYWQISLHKWLPLLKR